MRARTSLRSSSFVHLILSASALSLSLTLAACASSTGALHAAETGDRPALKRDVLQSEAAGSMTNRDAARLGRAVAAHELESAKGADAAKRVEDVEACAVELDSQLADRAKRYDAAGADAEMLRIEDGRVAEARAKSVAADAVDTNANADASDRDAWRAIAARGLIAKKDGDARRRAMRDENPAVRRAAMRAASRAIDPADEAVLAESARVDPDPFVRGLAVRAIGALPPQTTPGIARVDRLRDLWTGGEDPLREDVAVAYTMPGVYKYGGEEALAVVLAEANGPGALAAAGAILRSPGMSDASIASARALLLRSLSQGSLRDRLHALAIAPHRSDDDRGADGQKDIDAAIVAMATDDDRRVRVAALSRLAYEQHRDHGSHGKQADSSVTTAKGAKLDPQAALRTLAASDDPAIASRARAALAQIGDRSVQAALEKDLMSPGPFTRLAAADALADLGMAGRAAPLLADDDAEVRTRAACTMIRAAER